jgi:hypothetical protein
MSISLADRAFLKSLKTEIIGSPELYGTIKAIEFMK